MSAHNLQRFCGTRCTQNPLATEYEVTVAQNQPSLQRTHEDVEHVHRLLRVRCAGLHTVDAIPIYQDLRSGLCYHDTRGKACSDCCVIVAPANLARPETSTQHHAACQIRASARVERGLLWQVQGVLRYMHPTLPTPPALKARTVLQSVSSPQLGVYLAASASSTCADLNLSSLNSTVGQHPDLSVGPTYLKTMLGTVAVESIWRIRLNAQCADLSIILLTRSICVADSGRLGRSQLGHGLGTFPPGDTAAPSLGV